MTLDWQLVDKTLFPIKGYPDACTRLRDSFSYPFVGEIFNYSMPHLLEYVHRTIGEDPEKRYTAYTALLERIFSSLQAAGVRDVQELKAKFENAHLFEAFVEKSNIQAEDIAQAIKFLIYWFIPGSKRLSGLVMPGQDVGGELEMLKQLGIRFNLEMLEKGRTPAGRERLAQTGEVELDVIETWVNRADLSRMPWASKATVSNLMGAGYPSVASLAAADSKKLYADFFAYGRSIGKNFKFGNEIENSQRIARVLPLIVH